MKNLLSVTGDTFRETFSWFLPFISAKELKWAKTYERITNRFQHISSHACTSHFAMLLMKNWFKRLFMSGKLDMTFKALPSIRFSHFIKCHFVCRQNTVYLTSICNVEYHCFSSYLRRCVSLHEIKKYHKVNFSTYNREYS